MVPRSEIAAVVPPPVKDGEDEKTLTGSTHFFFFAYSFIMINLKDSNR